jgi:hypothetical protein
VANAAVSVWSCSDSSRCMEREEVIAEAPPGSGDGVTAPSGAGTPAVAGRGPRQERWVEQRLRAEEACGSGSDPSATRGRPGVEDGLGGSGGLPLLPSTSKYTPPESVERAPATN